MANIFSIFGQVFIDNTKANKSLDTTTEKAEGSSNKIKNSFSKIAKGAAAVGSAVVAGASAIGAGVMKMATDAAQTETAFAKVNTLLSGTQDEAQAIFDSIKQASINTGVAVTDFSEAVYGAISASVEQGKAVDFVTSAVKLAKGGFTETATAVDVLTTAINAYGLSADDATNISDTLIMTQNLGKTTVDELAASMGQTIPVANGANVALNDLSTQYAVLTKNGVATAQAGTQIKAMLGELSKSGSITDKALRELTGKGFADLQKQGKTTAQILSMLDGYAAKNNLTLKDLFGSVEAGSAALTMVKDGGEDFANILDQIDKGAGATEKAYSTMAGTLEESINKLKNSFKVIYNNLGERLIPVVQKIADMIQQRMPQIQAFTERLGNILTKMLDSILPPLFDLCDALLPSIFDLIEQLLPLCETIISAVLPVIISLIQQLLPFAVQIAQQILPIIAEIITSLMPVFSQILSAVLPIILQLLQALLPPLLQVAEVLLPPILSIIQTLTPILTQILDAILPLLLALINALLPILQPILDLLVVILEPLNELLQLILPPLVEFLNLFIQNLLPQLNSAFEFVANGISEKFSWAFGFISGIFSSLKDIFGGIIDFIGGVFTGNWEKAWNGVVNIFKGIFNLIPTIVESVINGAIGIINGITSGINSVTGLIGIPEIPKIPNVQLPRLRVGIDYVPYDEYPALLHKGERVLTQSENKDYTQNGEESGNNQTININFSEKSIYIERLDGENEQDVEELADTLLEIIADKIKRKGVVFG